MIGISEIAYEVTWVALGFVIAGIYALIRRFLTRRAFNAGELREEVIVIANILEDDPASGQVFLKPRTAVASRSVRDAFPNPILAQMIIKATRRCNTESMEGPFVRLSDDSAHNVFMKRVVDIASAIGVEGHILRMCGVPVKKNDCYVCCTFSPDGKHRKIRIDLISGENLRRFLDFGFVHTLASRPEEGSHADMAAIFAQCAHKVFEHRKSDASTFVRRVSIPTPL